MYYHPNTILAMHDERQRRLEVEAARYAFVRSLRRRRRLWWRRPVRQPALMLDMRPS
jgi:hypothetical protein